MKKNAAAGKGALGHIMLGAAWVLFAAGLRAGGPCDPPPFDPLSPVATAEAAVEMDSWAIRALRRDVRGRTCTEVQRSGGHPLGQVATGPSQHRHRL